MLDEGGQFGPTDASDETDSPIAPAPPADLAAAKFDDGGLIELPAVGVVADVLAAPVTDSPPPYPFEVTFDSGVALFQALEMGGELGTVPVAPPIDPAPPTNAPATGSAEEAGADESQGTPRRAAANLGLGLLVAMPLAMMDKRSKDERRNERRHSRPIKD